MVTVQSCKKGEELITRSGTEKEVSIIAGELGIRLASKCALGDLCRSIRYQAC